MKNKDVLIPAITIICGLVFVIELGVLGLINYVYSKQWLGCTMAPNIILSIICQWGAIVIFLILLLNVFLGYISFISNQRKGWYAPILVIFIGIQIILLLSISHANI